VIGFASVAMPFVRLAARDSASIKVAARTSGRASCPVRSTALWEVTVMGDRVTILRLAFAVVLLLGLIVFLRAIV
jgi:hypothetical protein